MESGDASEYVVTPYSTGTPEAEHVVASQSQSKELSTNELGNGFGT